MRKIIFEHSIKRSQRWLGGEPSTGQWHKGGNARYRRQLLSRSVFYKLRHRRAGYEVPLKRVSGYFGSESFSMNFPQDDSGDILAVGPMTAHCPPNCAPHHCSGISLVEVLIALTLLSISSLLILQFISSLQLSEQTLWQRRETWWVLAQQLEGRQSANDAIIEQLIAETHGCYWQRVAWQVAKRSPLYLERLHCPQKGDE